jgi:hypothetical protein
MDAFLARDRKLPGIPIQEPASHRLPTPVHRRCLETASEPPVHPIIVQQAYHPRCETIAVVGRHQAFGFKLREVG